MTDFIFSESYLGRLGNDDAQRERNNLLGYAAQIITITPSGLHPAYTRPLVAAQDAEYMTLEIQAGYETKAFMSYDGLITPVSMDGDGGLPRFVRNSLSGVSDASGCSDFSIIKLDDLNPLTNPAGFARNRVATDRSDTDYTGHDWDLVGRTGTDLNNTPSGGLLMWQAGLLEGNGLAADYRDDYRFMALRGPIILQSWGYDLQGNPIPNKNDSLGNAVSGVFTKNNLDNTKFLDNHLRRRDSWPVAPVDFRFDRDRNVWVSPTSQSWDIIKILCNSGCGEATPVCSGTCWFHAQEVVPPQPAQINFCQELDTQSTDGSMTGKVWFSNCGSGCFPQAGDIYTAINLGLNPSGTDIDGNSVCEKVWMGGCLCCSCSGCEPTVPPLGCRCLETADICDASITFAEVVDATWYDKGVPPSGEITPNANNPPTNCGVCEACDDWNQRWRLVFIGEDLGEADCLFGVLQEGASGSGPTADIGGAGADIACFPCHSYGDNTGIIVRIGCDSVPCGGISVNVDFVMKGQSFLTWTPPSIECICNNLGDIEIDLDPCYMTYSHNPSSPTWPPGGPCGPADNNYKPDGACNDKLSIFGTSTDPVTCPEWASGTTYNNFDCVTWECRIWEASGTTQGSEPGSVGAPWDDIGPNQLPFCSAGFPAGIDFFYDFINCAWQGDTTHTLTLHRCPGLGDVTATDCDDCPNVIFRFDDEEFFGHADDVTGGNLTNQSATVLSSSGSTMTATLTLPDLNTAGICTYEVWVRYTHINSSGGFGCLELDGSGITVNDTYGTCQGNPDSFVLGGNDNNDIEIYDDLSTGFFGNTKTYGFVGDFTAPDPQDIDITIHAPTLGGSLTFDGVIFRRL